MDLITSFLIGRQELSKESCNPNVAAQGEMRKSVAKEKKEEYDR